MPLFSSAQKRYLLSFINNEHRVIKKHPDDKFKDSIQLKDYLSRFQMTAVKKGYLLASFDSIVKRNETEFHVLFSLGEKFEMGQLKLNPEEQLFIRKKVGLSEKIF